MNMMKQPGSRWLMAGAAMGLCVLLLVILGTHWGPGMLVDNEAVLTAVAQTLECARTGDLEALEDLLYGTANLGAGPGDGETAQETLWRTYLSSIQFSLPERCHAQDGRVAVTVQVQALDLSQITSSMAALAPELLEQKLRESEEADVYTADNGYREEFLAQVLLESAQQVLAQETPAIQRELTLTLLKEEGRWQVVPTEELLEFLSGFVSG